MRRFVTGKLNYSLLVFPFAFAAAVLLFSMCGNPIIKSMMSQPDDEILYGTFHTADLSGLPAYINENRLIHPSRDDPVPVRILGGDTAGVTALKSALKDTDIKDCYLSLDMRGMDNTFVPPNYFDADFSSNSRCRIVSVKLSTLVTRIDSEAFSGNQYIRSVSMPGVGEIGDNAFADAYSLRELYMPVNPPLTMSGNNHFSGINISRDDFIVYVPAGAKTEKGQSNSYYEWAESYLLDNGNNDFNIRFRRYKQ